MQAARVPAWAAILTLATTSWLAAQRPVAPGGAPARDAQVPTFSGTAVLRGRVTAAAGGAPVRQAQIRASNNRDTRLVATDAEGRFELRDLIPGPWTLSASKAGFVTQPFGQRRPFAPAAPIELADGDTVTADFALTRSGAISGRVYDEFGDPIEGVRVQVLRSQMVRGQRQLAPVGVADSTDDTGAFRLWALPAGEYYVGAGRRSAPAESPFGTAVTGVPTYYPGTPRVADAQPVVLGPGEERWNVDFPLVATGAARVIGRLLDSTGTPVENVGIDLVNTADASIVGFALGNFGMTHAGGDFTIVNVPPGNYELRAMLPGAGTVPEQAYLPLTVGADDVEGVVVAAVRGATLEGRVVAETPQAALPTAMVIAGVSDRGNGFTRSVDASGAFSLPGLVGVWTLNVRGLQDRWMVKSIEINGRDLTDTPIEFGGTEQRLAARIVLTDRVTTLAGVVSSGGRPVPGAWVVVFPEDPAKWFYTSRSVRWVQTDAEGRFHLRSLPPSASYHAVAVDYLEDGEPDDPRVLDRLKRQSVGVSLDEGKSVAVDLDLITR